MRQTDYEHSGMGDGGAHRKQGRADAAFRARQRELASQAFCGGTRDRPARKRQRLARRTNRH